MPNGIEVAGRVTRASVNAVQSDLAALDKAADRAAMWTVREIARKFKRAAARTAPIYSGPPRRVRVNGALVALEPRELKKSFSSSKRLNKRGKGDYSVVVGPRGAHVHLHAALTDQRRPFVKTAYEEAIAQARSVHEKALERALSKGRR